MSARVGPTRRTAWPVALAIGVTMMLIVGCAVGQADAGMSGSQSPSADAAASASATTRAVTADSMIIDHRHTHLVDVPLEWVEAAKTNLHIAYGHSSHGDQIVTGMTG